MSYEPFGVISLNCLFVLIFDRVNDGSDGKVLDLEPSVLQCSMVKETLESMLFEFELIAKEIPTSVELNGTGSSKLEEDGAPIPAQKGKVLDTKTPSASIMDIKHCLLSPDIRDAASVF